jgi:chromosomal replication initiation ATPase DnaA
MINHPNISIAFISENTHTTPCHPGAVIEGHLKDAYKILRCFTTEFLELPINVLKENLDTFSITDWIKELPEFDILILEESQELKERTSSQIFLGNILIELINTQKKIILLSTEKANELHTLKEHLYSNLQKENILEIDFQNDLF